MTKLTRSKMLNKVSGVSVIGYNFAMQLNSDMYEREAVLKAAETQGFDTSNFPEPSKRNSFKNAMRKQMKLNKDAEKVLHFVEETASNIIFQVDKKVLERVSMNGSDSDGNDGRLDANIANYQREMLVVFDKTTDRVICDNKEVLKAVYQLLNVYQKSYSKQNLTRYVLNLLENNTSFVPYIKGTGVYFVPSHQKQFMTKVIEFLYEVDGTANTVICEIPDTPNAKDVVMKSTAEKFSDMRKEQYDEIMALAAEEKSLTESMKVHRIEKISKTARVIEEYEILLGKELKEAKKSIKASEIMVKNYFKFGVIENPFQKLIDQNKENAEALELIKSEVPDDVLELLDFD